MEERGNFYDDGSGWACRPCERDVSTSPRETDDETPHVFVKWTDATCRHLTCPRCGITEPHDLS